jgi:hypothetical protein
MDQEKREAQDPTKAYQRRFDFLKSPNNSIGFKRSNPTF